MDTDIDMEMDIKLDMVMDIDMDMAVIGLANYHRNYTKLCKH
jgi:hypothetical protein